MFFMSMTSLVDDGKDDDDVFEDEENEYAVSSNYRRKLTDRRRYREAPG